MTHIGQRIEQVRKTHGLTQKEFGTILAVTAAYISAIESGRKTPSKIMVKLLCYEFSVRMPWLENGEGEPFADQKRNSFYKTFSVKQMDIHQEPSKNPQHMLIMAALLGQDLPVVGASVASGINVSDILDKMKTAYGVKTNQQLAEKHLKIDNTSMTHWVSKNKIPRKHLEKAVEDTKMPLEYFLLKEEVVERGIEKILCFVREQITQDRECQVDLDGLKDKFREQFQGHWSWG